MSPITDRLTEIQPRHTGSGGVVVSLAGPFQPAGADPTWCWGVQPPDIQVAYVKHLDRLGYDTDPEERWNGTQVRHAREWVANLPVTPVRVNDVDPATVAAFDALYVYGRDTGPSWDSLRPELKVEFSERLACAFLDDDPAKRWEQMGPQRIAWMEGLR